VGPGETQIRAMEEKERDAMARGDTAALEQYWDKELIVNAPGGRIRTASEVLAFVKSGDLKYTSLERQTERVALHGDVAIAMGAETVVLAAGPDAGKTLHRRFTDVFARQGGQWRLIARQMSVVQ
jgi:ketosteroid isomerase-like protein